MKYSFQKSLFKNEWYYTFEVKGDRDNKKKRKGALFWYCSFLQGKILSALLGKPSKCKSCQKKQWIVE